jgi:hypothetical protein
MKAAIAVRGRPFTRFVFVVCFVTKCMVATDARAEVTPAQATEQVAEIARWDVSMQSMTCSGSDAGPCLQGAVLEAQNGPPMFSWDNTAEAIFDWAYEEGLSGDAAYQPNIALAFTFLERDSPFSLDGTMSTIEYPTAYICGWMLRAVVAVETATGDASHHAAGVGCAAQVEAVGPALATDGAPLVNVGAAAWGASGLWLWGEANGDEGARARAAAIGGQVKAWIESDAGR